MGNVFSGVGRFFKSYDQKGLNTINIRTRELAWFASSAYNRSPEPEHRGFILQMNAPTVKVWVSEERREVVVAIRGTQTPEDVKTDIKLAIERENETTRYNIARNIVLAVLRRYKGYKVVLTGHSLGGGLVYRIADEFPHLTGEVFNPAVNMKTIRNETNTSTRIRTHVIDGEPVAGILGRPLRNTQVYSPAYGEEREKIMAKPFQERMLYLHALKRFPQV